MKQYIKKFCIHPQNRGLFLAGFGLLAFLLVSFGLKVQETAAQTTKEVQKTVAETVKEVPGTASSAVIPDAKPAAVPASSSVPFPANAMPGANIPTPVMPGVMENAPVMFKGMPVNASVLQHMKNEWTFQLQQIQQMLRSLQPQDEQLAKTLKEQQAEILKDLKDVNEQLEKMGPNAATSEMDPLFQGILDETQRKMGQIPNPNTSSVPANNPLAALNQNNKANAAGVPLDNNLTGLDSGLNANAAADSEQKIKKVENAIILLREAGLPLLANQAANQIPNLLNPAFTEEPLNTGINPPVPGLTDITGAANPYEPLPSKEVTELKTLISELKGQLSQMANDLTDVQTQLKLLSRQIVQPAVAPVTPQK